MGDLNVRRDRTSFRRACALGKRPLPLVSPVYDAGATEEEVRGRGQEYWRSIDRADATPAGE